MDGSGSGCFWQFVGVLSVADASLECRAAARSCRMLPDALYALVAMLVRDFAEHQVAADVDPRLQAESMNGHLYGIGVGPGDPELLTMKAARILGCVDLILAASSTKNEGSLALDIARPHLSPGAEIISLGFPMTRSGNGAFGK